MGGSSFISSALISVLLLARATSNEAEAFGISSVLSSLLPQPPGLPPDLVVSLAQKRYGDANSNNSNEMYPMRGRVAVITGAAGGIGRELSLVVHGLGGTVVALDRNETGLQLLVEDSKSSPWAKDHYDARNDNDSGEIMCIPTHHEDLGSVSHAATQIASKFDSVDILVNNAGLAYPMDIIPGSERMRSAHGNDLAFTVNYLSHVLLVEKLIPLLNASASGGRIVHVMSTYHFKVDGSELIPQPEPLAYQSDPQLMSAKHVERSYANTKLAQIWHSRCITGCASVCACPTWAGTGIAGEANREFLERFAFPVGGAGIASILNAMFRTDEELGDALGDGRSIIANSRVLEYLPFKELWLSDLATELGWRDGIVDFAGLILLIGQRFTFSEFCIQRSSSESYNNREGMKALYEWSLKEVEPWLERSDRPRE